VMGSHIAKVGRNLDQATGAYNAFVGSFESQVLTQARRFEALDIETGDKEIPVLPVAEQSARPLAKLAAAPAAVNDAGE
jgi:DNA recombination protein RmuC